MKLTKTYFLVLAFLFAFNSYLSSQEIYKNSQAQVEKRVENLLQQMTLEEKIEQMVQDAPQNTRLGIPLMQYGECLHGLVLKNATVFPQAIALGSTWNPSLIEKIASGIAQEARNAGITHCYSPVLDIVRDPRYGRVEECYGEDPYLVRKMGVAFIQGLQGIGDERFDNNHVLATAKHFAAYSEPQQGINGAYVDISKRTLYEIFLPPFEDAVKIAKVGCVMPGHQDLNGIPVHMNTWLLKNLLRDEWGFEGFIVSDNTDIYRLHAMHKIAKNKEEAAILGLQAGVDMDLVIGKRDKTWTYNTEVLLRAIEMNEGVAALIDVSVSRILKAKFELGLFDEQVVEPQTEAISLKENQKLALEAAKQSIILLKNAQIPGQETSLLPLKKKTIKSIAVIGPNSHGDNPNEIWSLQGGYSEMPPFYTSLYDGIKNEAGKEIDVYYAEGCDLLDNDKSGFNEALVLAMKSDVVVMGLGGSSITCREGRDRDNIFLTGMQNELLREIVALGKPVVLVLINGRPLDISWASENVPAILETWYSGMYGGEAIADILFGNANPSAKLTVSFPRHMGQLPISYLQKPDFLGSGGGQYLNKPDKTALYPFGHGLSYTTFEYIDLKIDKNVISKNEETEVSMKITNTGNMAGDEIVQMYIKDDYASIGRYHMYLKGFQRVSLNPGETKVVKFKIGFNELFLYDKKMNKELESGEFTVFIGSSSAEENLIALKLTVFEN